MGRAPLTGSRVLHLSTVAAMTASALLTLAACGAPPGARASHAASAARTTAKALPVGPVGPAIESATWINTAPLAWDSLRGQVVMVEFWTYSCINCQNVVPLMKSLHADYADRGFTKLGILRFTYIGEGGDADTRQWIETLLAEQHSHVPRARPSHHLRADRRCIRQVAERNAG